MAESNYEILIEMRESIIEYLEDQKSISEDALTAYEPKPIQDTDEEVRRMREKEAIKLRYGITELKRHISVIKKMFPSSKK